MSAPTIAGPGYEIEEQTVSGTIHLRAIDTTQKWRPGIVGAIQAVEPGDDEWMVLIYGGADPNLLPLSLIPNGTLRTRSKETALEWIHCIAALYAKAVAA